MSQVAENSTSNDLPQELAEKIESLAHASFMLPEAARKAMELAKDPNCDVEDFLVVIQRDPKLASDILGMANSASFSANIKIASLQQAVVRLGFRQCRNLILAAAFSSLMAQWPARQHVVRNALWRHSYTTASLCQRFNREFRLRFEGEEFTAGLIHDFGRFALAFCHPELCHPEGHIVGEETATILELETRVAGANHCQVGAFIAGINEMPSFLTDAIRYHHSPQDCPPENLLLCSLISACDHMGRHLFTFNSAEGYLAEENPWIALLEANGSKSIAEGFIEKAETIMSDVLENMKSNSLANL